MSETPLWTKQECSFSIKYGEGSQLWAFISQSFLDKNTKFLCSLDWKFAEFFKTHQTFIFRPLPRPVMGIKALIPVFFGTPCSTIRNTEHFLYNRSQLCQPHLVVFQNATKWGIIKEPALSLPLSRKGGRGGGLPLAFWIGNLVIQHLKLCQLLQVWPLKGGVKGLPPAFWIPYLVIHSLKLGQLLQVFPDL